MIQWYATAILKPVSGKSKIKKGFVIYSIGHSNKSIEYFIDELNAFQIKYLVDVRSKPYSRYNPQFRKKNLEEALCKADITYVFLGHQLGGMPNDESCYTNRKVDYEILKRKSYFVEGLERLVKAYKNKVRVAIMCSEKDPRHCHRTKLIGQELVKRHIPLLHIIEKGKVKDQQTVVLEMNKGVGSLF